MLLPANKGAAPRCPANEPHRITSRSPAMVEALRLAEAAAPHETTVVILGETGTGKGLLARNVHERSRRRAHPFVELNCAGLQKELTESELFGHERGAFTGAAERKLGLFEAAAGGTVFLDEIGELDPGVQAKLLKAIEDRSFRRLGGLAQVEVDVRLVAATHRDLEREVAAGRFRRDLFYRLNVFTVRLPALRERPEDVVPLALQFLNQYAAGLPLSLSPAARARLQAYEWPGNVRELRNVMERATILARGEREIGLGHLPRLGSGVPLAGFDDGRPGPRPLTIREAERERVEEALAEHRGNVAAAAAQLGVSRGTVYRKARKYNIPY
ncbi:MAG TPA: sigma 54-interacting transcriptional regulator [Vicinamibacteria bacterium]